MEEDWFSDDSEKLILNEKVAVFYRRYKSFSTREERSNYLWGLKNLCKSELSIEVFTAFVEMLQDSYIE